MLKPQPSLHSCVSGSSSWKAIQIPNLQIASETWGSFVCYRTQDTQALCYPKHFLTWNTWDSSVPWAEAVLQTSCQSDAVCCLQLFSCTLCLASHLILSWCCYWMEDQCMCLRMDVLEWSFLGSGVVYLLRIQPVLYPKKEMRSLFPVTRDLPECAALIFFSAVLHLHQLWTNSLNLLFSTAAFWSVDILRIGKKHHDDNLR